MANSRNPRHKKRSLAVEEDPNNDGGMTAYTTSLHTRNEAQNVLGGMQTDLVKFKHGNFSLEYNDEEDEQGLLIKDNAASTRIPPSHINYFIENARVVAQCLNVTTTMVCGSGPSVVPIREGVEIDENEKELLQSYFDMPLPGESWREIYQRMVFDDRAYNPGYIEIHRDSTGAIVGMSPVKGEYIEPLPIVDSDFVAITSSFMRGKKSVTLQQNEAFRRFKFFTDKDEGNKQTVFYKSFGDPRIISRKTGKDITEEEELHTESASELFVATAHMRGEYRTNDWLVNYKSMFGSMEAEELNLQHFHQGGVPKGILAISDASMTGDSSKNIDSFVKRKQGKEKQNELFVLEVFSSTPESSKDRADPILGSSARSKPRVSIEWIPMAQEQTNDHLFQNYTESNDRRVRAGFLMPPGIIGLSEDQNYATANTSIRTAEKFLTAPLRNAYDDMLNAGFINHPRGLNLKTVKLLTEPFNISDTEEITKAATAVNQMGGLTMRTANKLFSKLSSIHVNNFPKKGDAEYDPIYDMPLAIALAKLGKEYQGSHLESGLRSEATAGAEEGDIGITKPENGQQ